MALQGFNETYYLGVKLAALQATKTSWVGKTTADVTAAFTAAGLTAEQHYTTYGYKESLAPNAEFNAAEYTAAKATQLFQNDVTSKYASVAAAQTAFLAAWTGDVYQHYLQFGAAENVNPSNAFDESSYYASKLAALKADPATSAAWATKTVTDLQASFKAAGFTALTHYELYGKTEGIAITAVPASEQVTAIGTTGTAFTLTTDPDNIAGTVNDDTIAAYVNYAKGSPNATASSTLTGVDVVAGGGGTDTLNITVDGVLDNSNAAVALPGADISAVKVLNVRNLATSNAGGDILTINASTISGLTSLNVDRSTSEVDFTNVASGASIGVKGNGTVVNGITRATYVAAATAATLNVSGGTTGGAITLVGPAVTTVTINSTGAANTVAGIAAPATTTAVNINATTNLVTGGITGVAAGTTITVSGAATSVDLGAIAANATTVNAAGLTLGGITATLGAVTDKVTGGLGNDVITTGGIVLTTGSVAAGDGTADKLIVTAAADVAAAPAAKYTGFEIEQNNVAAVLDASLVAGITSVVINNAGASGFLNLNATQAGAVSALQSTAGSTLALKDATGLSDVISITGTTKVAATAVNITDLIVTGVETLKYTNSATAASTLSLAGAGSTGLTTITVAGANGVTLDIAAAGTPAHATTLTAINASGLTAQATGTNTFTLQDTVGGHALANGLTVTGSAGDDLFSFTTTDTLAAGVVATINAGAGNDGITATIAQLYSAGLGYLVVDGGANATAGDTLTISNAAAGTISDSTFAHVSNIENLAFSNAGAINLTSGGFFNTAFAGGVNITDGATTVNAVTIDLSLYSAASKITNVGTTGVQTITGGSGADKITVTSAAAATGAGTVVVTGGAGVDTIKVTDASVITVSGTVAITGGTGADSITSAVSDATKAVSSVIYTVAVGDSVVGTSDSITGYTLGTGVTRLADTINFAGAAIAPVAGFAATAVTGHTIADLTVAVSVAGKITFAGTSAATLTATQVESIWTSQISGLLNTLETAVWADANAADTHNGDSLVFNHNTLGDSEVILVGVQATAVGAAAVTASLVGIA